MCTHCADATLCAPVWCNHDTAIEEDKSLRPAPISRIWPPCIMTLRAQWIPSFYYWFPLRPILLAEAGEGGYYLCKDRKAMRPYEDWMATSRWWTTSLSKRRFIGGCGARLANRWSAA